MRLRQGMGLAGLALATALSAQAQTPTQTSYKSESLTNVCEERAERIFATGMESMDGLSVVGAQNCTTLEDYVDLSMPPEVTISLPGGAEREFASLTDEYFSGNESSHTYTAHGVPLFASFDPIMGKTTLAPLCADAGIHSVDYGVMVEGMEQEPVLRVNYDITCPASTVVIEGLDLEGNGAVSSTPQHGTWSSNGGVINNTLYVREGRSEPLQVEVLTNKNDIVLHPISEPSYVTLNANTIQIQPPIGEKGQAPNIVYEVCDAGALNDCTTLTIPTEIADSTPIVLGLSYSGQNGTIDNYVNGTSLEEMIVADCQAGVHQSWAVTDMYDPNTQWGWNVDPYFNINGNYLTGEMTFDPDCQTFTGQELQGFMAALENSGSSNDISFTYAVPEAVLFYGLDFENDGLPSSTPYHGTWADDDGVIDETVIVREGRISPHDAYVLTDKADVTLTPIITPPNYITTTGNKISFHPLDGAEGEGGTLRYNVCDVADPTACRQLEMTYQVADKKPVIAGLSYSGQNGTIDNPVEGPSFRDWMTIDCQLPDSKWIVEEIYDPGTNYHINGVEQGDRISLNPATGEILMDADCDTQAGQGYTFEVKIVKSSGNSDWVDAVYLVE